jgi:hypothetical protein
LSLSGYLHDDAHGHDGVHAHSIRVRCDNDRAHDDAHVRDDDVRVPYFYSFITFSCVSAAKMRQKFCNWVANIRPETIFGFMTKHSTNTSSFVFLI